MLVAKKDFMQYKKGDFLPDKLPDEVQSDLVKQGLAEIKGASPNAYVRDYIRRTKNDRKKNYYRKPRQKK